MIDLTGIAEKVDITITVLKGMGFLIDGKPSTLKTIFPEVEETCLHYGIPCCIDQVRISVEPDRVGLGTLKIAEKFYEHFQQNYKVRLINPD